MSTQAEQIADLDARVKALEDLKLQAQTMGKVIRFAWVTIGFNVATLAAAAGYFIWDYAKVSVWSEVHKRDIVNLQAALDKTSGHLQAALDKTSGRLQSWEDKGFRHQFAQAFFRDGTLVSVKASKLTVTYLDEDDKEVTRTFTVEPTMQAEIDGSPGKTMLVRDIAPKTPISFMLDAEGSRIAVLRVLVKKRP